MTNVSFNPIVSALGAPGNFVASDMWGTSSAGTGNFNLLTAAVNVFGLNSQNYSQSGVLSQHIAVQEINAVSHMQDGIVASAKLSDSAVVQEKVVFRSESDGVRVEQAGVGIPAAGLQCARITETRVLGPPTSSTFTIPLQFSNALEGDPAFTESPTLTPIMVEFASGSRPPAAQNIFSLDSTSAQIKFYMEQTYMETVTVHVEAWGPK